MKFLEMVFDGDKKMELIIPQSTGDGGTQIVVMGLLPNCHYW